MKRVYTPEDIRGTSYKRDLGLPGETPSLEEFILQCIEVDRGRCDSFRDLGLADQTNKRLKYLLKEGETGLSIAFDMPTLYGYDADSERAEGEVGKCGVSVSSLEDMETIFQGIPLDQVSTSMTINAPAAVLTAMYAAVGEKQGVPLSKLRGTVQTDILKEYIAQKEWAFPPDAHLRIIRDLMIFLHPKKCRTGITSASPDTTFERLGQTLFRSSRSLLLTASHTSSSGRTLAWMWMPLLRGCLSSSTATWISSKRLQSSEQRGGSGRMS